ncbi:MAG TPA: hypothetical protein VHV30_02410 [Polyangiaceae bacterium]|jgi:hypothetical protein|nr:hypothetical protein [Polyangiaceae bacterium]
MIPFGRQPVSEPPPEKGEPEGSSRHSTLPPPEVATIEGTSRATVAPRALPRRTGTRADQAWLGARVEDARRSGDAAQLRAACVTLARWLGSRDRDLDEAVRLASEALAIGEDIELRREVAAWLESLGAASRAATVLKPIASLADVESQEASYVLVRVGVLKARAGEAAGAAAAFDAAVSIDAGDALPAELFGALSAWREEAVSPSDAADAYVEAARRRAAAAQDEAQLEDLWRAFAIDAAHEATAAALVEALEARRRFAAADEARRAHARAVAKIDADRAEQHRASWRAAARAPDRPGRSAALLLGEALDLGMDGALSGPDSEALDALLLEVGMLDTLGVRLEMQSQHAETAAERAAAVVELGRLRAGSLGSSRSEAREDVARAWAAAAQGGDVAGQASAIERMAAVSSPALVPVLLSVAADRYLAAGDRSGARRAAERATQADPTSARSVTALANAVVEDGDRGAAAALERAIALVGPRVTWCLALADGLAALGEAELSVGWSQRCVALRPGDRDAIQRLLERLRAARDPWRLGDALAWLLSQPQPVSQLAAAFAEALGDLARLDSDRAAVVARRSLDVLGPDSTPVREAMFDVAAKASDDAFAAAIYERWLSCGAEGADRPVLYAALADLRQRLADEESEIRALARAVREGAWSPALDAHLERLAERPATPDAQIWRMEVRAERASVSGDSQTGALWRDLGGALWDLADDRAGALAAWSRAARSDKGPLGWATLSADLIAFSDASFARQTLTRMVDDEADDRVAALMAAGAARGALAAGEFALAFDVAARGVARDSSRADSLELAERAAQLPADQPMLSGLYELVASRALGRFGRRAAHYRGARLFERRGEHGLALKHAAQAFYAVPSEGASFHLLARAAERAGDRAHAVHTVEQVAESAGRAEVKAGWLLRAASIAGEGEDGARRKVDVLLRAVVATPSVAIIALLRDAGRDLLRFGPEERGVLEMRMGRAAKAITGRVEGPEGARVAIAFAEALLDLFGDVEGALGSVERAFACDGDMDEYERLVASGASLASAANAAERTAALLARAEDPHANVGVGALRLLASMAAAAGDPALQARAAVAKALREPDDDASVIAADAAARTSPDLEARLAKKVPAARRAEALVASGRARASDGQAPEAAALLERAVELADEAAKPAIERELRAAWAAAGRSAEIEARVEIEAGSDRVAPAARADRWTEVAERRESRGDRAGAMRAQVEACKLDPEPLERWSALERLAEAAGDDSTRVTALEAIAMRVGSRGRVAVFKRLARTHERRHDVEAAERAWQRVLALDPDDEEADQAVEAAIVERGRYEDLAEHLGRRADRLSAQTEKKEMLRAVRLRRAAILEQRLGRVDEACDELSRLLAEWPNSPGALRYLADLLERRGDFAHAAPLWQRAAALESDPAGRDELDLRAGRAALASGDPVAALEHVARIAAGRPSHQAALELRVEVARVVRSDRDLGDALEGLASAGEVDGVKKSEWLLEAAQAAARAGDSRSALERARQAAEAAPDRATPQLLARALEYRLQGAGAPDEARRTIEELGRVQEAVEGPDAALRAFLLAEALDVVQGGGAGLRELESVRAQIGEHPLLGLGLAERYAALGDASAAVDAYRIALRGSLLDLRKAGSVALHAADAAIRADRDADAAHFLDLAQTDPDTREQAQGLRRKLIERATPPPPAPVSVEADRRLEELEAAVRAAATPVARASSRVALARARLERGDRTGAEPLLWEALADGMIEAGDALAPILASTPDRVHDVVRLRRQQVALEPGDVGRLELLRAAAIADDDRVYARAVEHVLRAFDPGAGPLPPPPLATQPEQPGIFALLTRPSRDAAGEAMASLWEGATHLFARDATTYGVAGLERVVPGPTSVVARLYEMALRLLDIPRVPLYLTGAASSPGEPTVQIALLASPAVLLAGDVRDDTSALCFALGWGLSGALPHNVLRLAVSPGEGMGLVEAMRAAFGPPEIGRRVDAHAARLAQSFWQTVPARTQRRLQELLGGGTFPDYAQLVTRAQQSGRRVGMFLAGDFAWAAHQLLAEATGERAPLSLSTLRALCDELPDLADLLRLAVSPEYAEARWHVVAPSSQRGMLSSGRYSLY